MAVKVSHYHFYEACAEQISSDLLNAQTGKDVYVLVLYQDFG